MKRVLVTGGAGFIGSHLCEKLLQMGNYVICVDNLFTGSKDNIKDLMDNRNFEFIEHDIVQALYVESEEIYNLACPASPIHYQYDPIKTAKTNIYGSVNMLDLARENASKILQASTSEVYGSPIIHPQKEEYWGNVNPIGVRACYDEGKRAAETFFMDYYRKYDIDIKIMRIFNTYGTGMAIDDGRVISNFIVQALIGKDITVYGDGSQTRSFCYVDDLVDGMILFMKADKGLIGPINFGNPEEITMVELAKLIIRLSKSTSKIVYKPLPQDDPERRKPDISKAQKYLGWEPTTSIVEGLNFTIEYYRKYLMLLKFGKM